jgi:hypothetical protein
MVRRLKAARMEIGERRGDRRRLRRRRKGTEMRELLDITETPKGNPRETTGLLDGPSLSLPNSGPLMGTVPYVVSAQILGKILYAA